MDVSTLLVVTFFHDSLDLSCSFDRGRFGVKNRAATEESRSRGIFTRNRGLVNFRYTRVKAGISPVVYRKLITAGGDRDFREDTLVGFNRY